MTEEHKENHGETHHKKSDKVTISKITLWQTVSALLGILLILSVFTGGFGTKIFSENSNAPNIEAQPREAQPSAPSTDMKSLIDDDAIEGDANAPVTIVEWSDYECPFCARFYSQTLDQIRTNYVDTGKVKLVFRDFPLSFHKQAQKAAEAAECAGEQGKYYEMHDKLFEEGVSGGVSSFKQYAVDIGLDTSKFDECLDSGAMASEVAKDMQDGQAAGIRGTPGFIINGQAVSGAQPFENFKKIIEAELAK
jgi:protein-disulfide isomerase